MIDQAKSANSSQSAGALTGSLNQISSDSTEEELKGVIKDFESYFVEQILKEMKDTFSSSDSDSSMGQYTDMGMDMVIEQMADTLVEDVGESLTQRLYEQMRRNYNMDTAGLSQVTDPQAEGAAAAAQTVKDETE